MGKLVGFLGAVALVYLSAMPGVALADSAAGGWNSNMGFNSASQEANAFNKAQALWLIKKGVNPGSPTIVNNNMTCSVAGSCQNGGTATNWNGVSIVDNSGSGDVTVEIDAEADQNAVSTTATGDFDIGDINF